MIFNIRDKSYQQEKPDSILVNIFNVSDSLVYNEKIALNWSTYKCNGCSGSASQCNDEYVTSAVAQLTPYPAEAVEQARKDYEESRDSVVIIDTYDMNLVKLSELHLTKNENTCVNGAVTSSIDTLLLSYGWVEDAINLSGELECIQDLYTPVDVNGVYGTWLYLADDNGIYAEDESDCVQIQKDLIKKRRDEKTTFSLAITETHFIKRTIVENLCYAELLGLDSSWTIDCKIATKSDQGILFSQTMQYQDDSSYVEMSATVDSSTCAWKDYFNATDTGECEQKLAYDQCVELLQ